MNVVKRSGKRVCFAGGHVWTGETKDILPGGLLVEGGTILGVLAPADIADASADADEVVDTGGMLLLPPFLNCHVHSGSSLFRGTENSLPLELWSYYAIALGREMSEEAIRHAVLLTDVEMIRNGIGGIVDHFPRADMAMTALAAHRQAGLRVGFAPFFADLMDEDILDIPIDATLMKKLRPKAPAEPAQIRETYFELDADIRASGKSGIVLLAGPNSPQRISDDLWSVWSDLQEELGIGSHTHLLETYPQASAAAKRWPGGLIAALDSRGFLHERISVAHAIWLTPADEDLLSRRGVTVVRNPISNSMLGSGQAQFRRGIDGGLRQALGTDSSNTGGRHDMFEVMRQTLTLGRRPGTDFETWPTPLDVMRAATQAGSNAIGPQCVGRLMAGGTADILFLDIDVSAMAASAPSLGSVVVHGDNRNVRSLMVGGEWLMKDRVLPRLDEAAIVAAASRQAADLRTAGAEMSVRLRNLHLPYKQWQARAFSGACGCGCGAFAAPNAGSVRTDS